MQINNNLSCCKPRKRLSFQSKGENPPSIQKVRYKRYEQMDEQTLGMNSVARAYKSVNKSKKMQLLNAMPIITATVIGAGLSLSQPGRLSAKAASGLGFLMIAKSANRVISYTNQKVDENYKTIKNKQTNSINNKKTKNNSLLSNLSKTTVKVLAAVGACTAAFLGAKAAYTFGGKLLNNLTPRTTNFFKNELSQLSSEINNTKLGNFVDKTLNPFIQKHQTKFNIASDIFPFLAVLGSIGIENKLAHSLSNDLKTKTEENFIKGKIIQQIAQENFNKIDAIEV